MGSRGNILAPVILLLLCYPHTIQAGLWTVDIDESPAPSPQDGPPFSAHASRDRSLLPGQICAIVGAYIASVVFTGSILLTIGKRMRKQALAIHREPALEMVKPVMVFGASPVSPGGSQSSWYSPRKLKKRLSSSGSMGHTADPGSPGLESNASFDYSVLAADRAARERELEFLYAAALEQEEENSQSEMPVQFGASDDARARPRQTRRPPRLLTTTHHNLPSPTSPQSTRSPIRAIYPPDSPYDYATSSPRTPRRTDYASTPLPLQHPPSPDVGSSSNPRSDRISQASSLGSRTSGQQPRGRRFLSGLRIITPISPDSSLDQEYQTPRTPVQHHRPDPGDAPTPQTAGSDVSITYDRPFYSEPHARPHIDRIDRIDRVRNIPLPAPQRRDNDRYPPLHASPLPLQQQHQQQQQQKQQQKQPTATSSPLRTLPFRALSSSHPSTHTSSTPSGSKPPLSPAATRTTYLSRPTHHPLPHQPHQNGPRTGGGGGPRTGGLRTAGMQVPMTPYSPYMPFTPITPVTPRLVGRAERRMREREVGRRALVAEEDGVREEEEIWGI